MSVQIQTLRTSVLDVAFETHGPDTGDAVILLHGFPYDPRCYDAMVEPLAAAGFRVVVPYLRGYGPTRFLLAATPRSGQQAALGHDLRELLDVLGISRAALVGYDWGGRAACIVAALWPERVNALVTGGGYNIQNIPAATTPVPPEMEHRLWYQYYLNTARGRDGLSANRAAFARLLWQLWSPNWTFDDATFTASAISLDNPDFVDVVVQSYRHRFGYAAGDPAYDEIEAELAKQPAISIPSIALYGDSNGVSGPVGEDADAKHFSGRYERRILHGIGHNIPQEAPEAMLAALRALTGK